MSTNRFDALAEFDEYVRARRSNPEVVPPAAYQSARATILAVVEAVDPLSLRRLPTAAGDDQP